MSRHRKTRKQDYKLQIADRDNWICHLCNRNIVDRFELSIDHVISLAKGGVDNESNIKAAHLKCNNLKADSDGLTTEQLAQLYPEIPPVVSSGFSLSNLFPKRL